MAARERRLSLLGLLAWLLVTSVATAWAHIDIEPKATIPNRWETFILNVPTEAESPTVEVHITIPEAFEVEAIGHRTDWQMTIHRDSNGLIRDIVWSGGQIPPLTFEEFKFLAKAAKAPGSYEWQARQRYADDQQSTWGLRTIVRAGGAESPGLQPSDALKTAQSAMTISFLAIGLAIVMLIIIFIALWRAPAGKGPRNA